MTPLMVVDTSVTAKWFLSVGEDSVREALDLQDAHIAGHVVLVAPATMPVELANALLYSKIGKTEVLAALERFDDMHIGSIETTAARLGLAMQLAYRHTITIYDALFLQLAEELSCPLVTADRRAFAMLEGCGVDVTLL